MRFIALAIFLMAIPVLQSLMRQDERYRHAIWAAFGALPFVTGAWHLDASIISWAMWPGYVKGMILSLLDATAVAVILATPSSRARTPFVWLLAIYIATAALSIFVAELKQASFFYVWQLARMILVFFAASRIATRPQGALYMMYGVMAGTLLQAAVALSQRFHGVAQSAGTMAHQNSLGMAMHFALYPSLALLLAGRRDKLLLFGCPAALLAVVLTGSRATIGLAVMGVAVLILLSMLHRPSSRKSGMVAVGIVAMILASPLAYTALSARLTVDSISSSDKERGAFKRAAWMIIDDHPFGIGANEYVVVANTGGYSERAGVIWNAGSRATNVHNTYLLMTAELGYLGGAAFILLMALPPLIVLRTFWKKRGDPNSELALGVAVSLAAVAAHCIYEWIYVTDAIQYLHVTSLGVAAGFMRQRQLTQLAARRKARAQAAARAETPELVTA